MSSPRLEEFLVALDAVPWLARAGEVDDDGVVRAASLAHALFRHWADAPAVWSGQSHALEERAVAAAGDAAIDIIFEAVQARIREPLWRALGAWVARAPDNDDNAEDAAAIDAMPRILSDISWAGVE